MLRLDVKWTQYQTLSCYLFILFAGIWNLEVIASNSGFFFFLGQNQSIGFLLFVKWTSFCPEFVGFNYPILLKWVCRKLRLQETSLRFTHTDNIFRHDSFLGDSCFRRDYILCGKFDTRGFIFYCLSLYCFVGGAFSALKCVFFFLLLRMHGSLVYCFWFWFWFCLRQKLGKWLHLGYWRLREILSRSNEESFSLETHFRLLLWKLLCTNII